MADDKSVSKLGLRGWIDHRIRREQIHIRRFYHWLGRRLWIQPLLFSISATLIVWFCGLADNLPLAGIVPDIGADLISRLLSVLTASMLGVATFAVASMVSAYSSIGTNATPRAFALIVADDVSKRALSSFVGAFILGTIGVIALDIKFYGASGRFALFVVTLCVYAWIIWIFLRWVDSIARLGRMSTAISRVEDAAERRLRKEAADPLMGGVEREHGHVAFRPINSTKIGYVQDIDMSALQDVATESGGTVHIAVALGSFIGPGRPIAYLEDGNALFNDGRIDSAFYVGKQRLFNSDPLFGFVVLAQIASRALSPGINDPGTANDVISSQTRLLLNWTRERKRQEDFRMEQQLRADYPDVHFPRLDYAEALNDAFTSISRDGAGQVEVMVRLQQDLQLLAAAGNDALREAALEFSKTALARARLAIAYKGDEKAIADAAKRVEQIALENRDIVE